PASRDHRDVRQRLKPKVQAEDAASANGATANAQAQLQATANSCQWRARPTRIDAVRLPAFTTAA
ncbi:hypothetical protein ACU4GD_01500, partial [Cupriavidus basilensis]